MRDGADGAREQRFELAAAMGAALMLAGIALWFVKAHAVEYISMQRASCMRASGSSRQAGSSSSWVPLSCWSL